MLERLNRRLLPLVALSIAACGANNDPAPESASTLEQAIEGSGVVTITGSGTITDMQGLAGPLPPELQAAFPLGAPFKATLTYDPSLVQSIRTLSPTIVDYLGVVTSFSAVAAGHVITATDAGFARVFNDQPTGTPVNGLSDGVAGWLAAEVDGSAFVEGFYVNGAGVGVYDLTGTHLSSVALPNQLCLAEWPRLYLSIQTQALGGAGYVVGGTSEPDRSLDSDGDGVSDGVELLHTCIDACAGDSDSDGDTLLDRIEIVDLASDPCSADTDGDGLNDNVDPRPLVPGTPSEELAEMARDAAGAVLAIPESSFEGPNANAERGRRNAVANRLQAAANEIEAGNLEEALDLLVNLLRLLDGDPSPPDVMEDGPEKEALRAEVNRLIALVEAELGG